MFKLISLRSLVAAAIVAVPFAAQGQDKPAAKTPAKTATAAPAKTTAKADTAKAPAKRKGQVPPYYGDVTNGAQKEKIYELQASFAEKIAAAKAALDAVTAERDAAIAGVLSPEQQAQVAKLKADADKARKEKADAAKTAKPAKT
jgi:DNA-binding protein HU-beta